jgi:predicted Fe-Mo cluster-binding NifX family protein
MRIAVSAQGETLDSLTSPIFGRCPSFILVDTETWGYEALANPAISQGGGAGIQAAQFILKQGAQALLTGNLGPNAFEVLVAAGVQGYLAPEGTVRAAVEAFLAGRLQPLGGANVSAHSGMGARAVTPPSNKETQMAELRETLAALRRQLAETMDKIAALEKAG